jgi:hypothetical protein
MQVILLIHPSDVTEPGILILKLLSITYLAQTQHGALREAVQVYERGAGNDGGRFRQPSHGYAATVGSTNASLGAVFFLSWMRAAKHEAWN